MSTRMLVILAATWLVCTQALAGNLEFTSGAGNPAGNGPTLAPVSIQFQLNSDDPAGNTFVASPLPVSATFRLSNQQFPNATTNLNGIMFGAATPPGGLLPPVASLLFPTMDFISGASNSDFSSTSAIIGQGIDLGINNAVQILTSTYPLFHSAVPLPTDGSAPGGRIYLGDLSVTFSTPVDNPVLHVVGMGANSFGLGFTTELELATVGVTPTLLSGDGLVIVGNNINNSHSALDALTGSGAASGSVLLTGAGVSQLTFKLYMRGDGGSPTWPAGGGDQFLVGFSLPPPLPNAAAVPVFSVWGLLLLSALLAGGAFVLNTNLPLSRASRADEE